MRTTFGILLVVVVDLSVSPPPPQQIHFPFPTYPQNVLADALAEVVDRGLASNVGVSNYSVAQMKEISDALAKRGGKSLVSNQVKYSMLDRSAEESGLLQAAADMGITIIAYSPLDKGLLSQLGTTVFSITPSPCR